MKQESIQKAEKKLTLIELMIVIAIIIILAAIAAPQFHLYRMRTYNDAVKPIVHSLKADKGDGIKMIGYGGWGNS